MNHIQQMHGHSHTRSEEQRVPFWVRYYDLVVNLVTLGRTAAVHRGTVSLAKLRPGDAVLDVGCGTGKLAIEIEHTIGSEGKVVGVDVEPAMVVQAQRRATNNHSRSRFEVASIEQIPCADSTFDVVFSTLMYHHLTEAQARVGIPRSVARHETGRAICAGRYQPEQAQRPYLAAGPQPACSRGLRTQGGRRSHAGHRLHDCRGWRAPVTPALLRHRSKDVEVKETGHKLRLSHLCPV